MQRLTHEAWGGTHHFAFVTTIQVLLVHEWQGWSKEPAGVFTRQHIENIFQHLDPSYHPGLKIYLEDLCSFLETNSCYAKPLIPMLLETFRVRIRMWIHPHMHTHSFHTIRYTNYSKVVIDKIVWLRSENLPRVSSF